MSRRLLGSVILVAALTAIVFGPSLRGEFLNWDDDQEVTSNPYVQSLSISNVIGMFSGPYAHIYHPLTTLSWAVEHEIAGYNPVVFHADNVMLHLLNSLLVLWLITLISRRHWVALVAAILFAVHPLRVESVAWVTERKDVLYAFFYLGALISYVYYVRGGRSRRTLLLAWVLMALSCLAKAMAVSLPLALLCVDFLYRRRFDWRLLLEKAPFFVLSLFFGIVAVLAQEGSGWVSIAAGPSLDQRLLFVGHALVLSLTKIVAPVGLSAIYPWPVSVSPLVPLALVALAGAVVYSLRYTRKIAFAAAFFLVTIAMVLPWSGSAKFVAADRFTYVPLLGVCYLAGEAVDRVFRSPWTVFRTRRGVWRLSLVVLVIALCSLSYTRVAVWQNSYALMSNVLEQDPNSVDARINRALASTNQGEAIGDYSIALALDPSRAIAYNNRGLIYYRRGEFDAAKRDYDEGIRRNPSYSLLYFNRMLYFIYVAKDGPRARADLAMAEYLGMRIDPKWRQVVAGM